MKNELPFTREQVERFHKDYEESARLRAAAPELLSAAKLLVALEENDVDPADTLWKQARKDLRLAIAKAEGGE